MPLILILTFFRRCVKIFLTEIGIETRWARLRTEIATRELAYGDMSQARHGEGQALALRLKGSLTGI